MGPALFELYSNNYQTSATTATSAGGVPRVRRANSTTSTPQMDNRLSSMSLNSISGGKLSEELSALKDMQRNKQTSPTRQRSVSGTVYRLKYVGSSTLDRTYTLPMLPWIIADVKRQSIGADGYSTIDVKLEITDSAVKIVNQADKQVLLHHPLHSISKFTQTSHDRTWFSYLFRDRPDSPFTIHIFQASDENTVSLRLSLLSVIAIFFISHRE